MELYAQWLAGTSLNGLARAAPPRTNTRARVTTRDFFIVFLLRFLFFEYVHFKSPAAMIIAKK
jgi:hypothetical protein